MAFAWNNSKNAGGRRSSPIQGHDTKSRILHSKGAKKCSLADIKCVRVSKIGRTTALLLN